MYRKDTKQGHDKLKNGLKSDLSTRKEVISHHEKHINQIKKHHGFKGQRGVKRKSKRQKAKKGGHTVSSSTDYDKNSGKETASHITRRHRQPPTYVVMPPSHCQTSGLARCLLSAINT
jgi:hypothetical protein